MLNKPWPVACRNLTAGSARKLAVGFGVGLLGVTSVFGGLFSDGGPKWSLEFKDGVSGQPVHFGGVEGTRGLLVTEHPGRVTLVSPQGEKRVSMTLDLPIETQAVAADLQGRRKLSSRGR